MRPAHYTYALLAAAGAVSSAQDAPSAIATIKSTPIEGRRDIMVNFVKFQ